MFAGEGAKVSVAAGLRGVNPLCLVRKGISQCLAVIESAFYFPAALFSRRTIQMPMNSGSTMTIKMAE